MTWHSILYFILLFTSIPYALVRGGAPERLAALVMVVAAALTIVALSASVTAYQDAEIGVFEVDVFAFAGFLGIALFADRYWPLLVTGLQADAVVIHLAKLIQPDILPLGYALGLSIWSYPILLLLAVGTRRHRRRLTRLGYDHGWSSSERPRRGHTLRAALKSKSDPRGGSIPVGSGALPRTSNGGIQ